MVAQTITQTCTKCKVEKPSDAFYWKTRGVKRNSHCKECHKDITHTYYRRNQAKYIAGARATKKANRERGRTLVAALKTEPCTDCGNRFPACAMQFDHVRGTKRKDVATLVGEGCSLRVIELEIAKCDLVCGNCHAIRTHARRLATRSVVTAG